MKVCVLSPGVVHAVPRTVAIADQFDEVHFIDITGKSDLAQLESHGVICHGPGTSEGVLGRRQLKQLFRTIEPSIIICHFASGDHFFDAIAYGNCPVAVIAMGQDVLYEAGDSYVPYLRRLLTRMALRRTVYISAKSRYLATRIGTFRVKAPVEVNYWGADLEHFSPGDRGEARRQLGWKKEGIYILSPRAIEPRLNIDVIIDAFPGVLESYPEATLVILGRTDPDYLQRIKKQISQLGISDNIILQGEVTQEMLPVYYRSSDMVLSMARSEGFPNTVLEVMSCRVPIVVGRIKQVEELLEDQHNARLCDISAQGISTAIADLLDLRGVAESQVQEAFATVSKYADIRTNGIRFSNDIKNAVCNSDNGTLIARLFFLIVYLIYLVNRKILY